MNIWLDGKLIDAKKAGVALLTHSLHYGSAVFEGIRFYQTENGPAIFRLRDHMDRFCFSAKVVGMKLPCSRTALIRAAQEVIRANKYVDGYIRPIAYFGTKMGLDPKTADVHVAVAAWPWGKYLKDRVRVKISKTMRIHPESTDVRAKISGHYVNSILATQEAKKERYDEALLLDHRGLIAEGPGENIFFVKGSRIITPTLGSILPGITRATIMRVARDLGYTVSERAVLPSRIKDFDEAFFTGTAAEVTPISSINAIVFPSSAVSVRIQNAYQEIVHGRVKKYRTWLTYVR